MKKYCYCLPAFMMLFLFSACQQTLYFPDRANTPGLTKALEAKGTISIKPQANDKDSFQNVNGNIGTSIDLAFSPVQHLGLIGSYRWINNRIIKEEQDIFLFSNKKTMGGVFNGRRWEMGAGYYNTFEQRGIVEFYGGYSNGSLSRVGVVQPEYNYDTKYHRWFIQPAMGARLGDYVTFTAGFKLAFVKYYDFEAANPDLEYNIANYNESVTGTVFTFIEPFFNVEGGYKFFKGNIQVGATKQVNQASISGNFPVYISFGMTFMFSPDFLKKDIH